ncbi:MAG: hypothetical protein ACXU8N_20805 [Telluria sp.]
MLRVCAIAAILVAALPVASALAQGEDSEARLAKLETILVTADKAQPRDYKPDNKTASLLAEIVKETAPKEAPVKAKK